MGGRSKHDKVLETELIQSLSRIIGGAGRAGRGIIVGPGDDAAVIRTRPGRDLIVTADSLIEGVHFERDWFTGRELGWRLAAVNISDIAAMGGSPRYALLSLGLPPDISPDDVKAIEHGAAAHLRKFGAAVIGGNISGSRRDLVCDLTLIGECGRGRAWRRNCLPGRDSIVVAGWLGSARAGLDMLKRRLLVPGYGSLTGAFKKPSPLMAVADCLRNTAGIHGAIDVSDGLSTDLIHLCRAGQAGCEVDLAALPIQPALQRYCRARQQDPAGWALAGGEDYALILSVDARAASRVVHRLKSRFSGPVRLIGRFTRRPGRYELILPGGRRRPFKPGGWDHLAG